MSPAPEPAGGSAATRLDDRPASPMGKGATVAAVILLVALTVVWTWWGWEQGAYFGTVLYPGIVLLCGITLILLWSAPFRASFRLSVPVAVALAAMAGLGLWSACSALWSPSPDVAIADAQRILLYALAFGLGLWCCNLLASRMTLACAPLAVAGALVATATVATLLLGDDAQRYLEQDGTLEFPLGYRNANAAFFAIAIWPSLGLAQARGLHPVLRALALAAATLCLELALLSQSRGSLPAAALALLVYVAVAPERARAIIALVLAAVPAAIVIPSLAELLAAAEGRGSAAALDELRGAGGAAALGALATLGVGLLAATAERRLAPSRQAWKTANRVATAGAILAATGAIAAFVVATGDPVQWIGQRATEFREGGTPGTGGASSRFALSAGSERDDLWRVALDEVQGAPLLGEGAGAFEYAYTHDRTVPSQTVHDAHSVELEVASELGGVGLILLLAALACAGAGAVRARRLGPEGSWLATVALAAGAYWLGHTSIDWFWAYPALTAPVFALLGAACAPTVLAPGTPRLRARRRVWLAIPVVALAISVVPPFLSDAYTKAAFEGWRADLDRAYADLDRAEALNPLSIDPLLAEGAIARAAGDDERAIDAFREAADRRPEEWAAHYFLGDLYTERAPLLAGIELRAALELNPLSERVRAAVRRLRGAPPPGE